MIILTLVLPGGLLGLLLKVAVCCVVIWAIYALLQWAGITIPRPVQIIIIALVCILIIYWLFQIFGALVQDTPVHPRGPSTPPPMMTTWDGQIVKHGQPL